mmetsp:Transcript_48071/g.75066  ORF Transcript_48071/g.75066 Transcript_48071/m.75066 type:complete len:271 (+) Transcript_48071:32-844(+)
MEKMKSEGSGAEISADQIVDLKQHPILTSEYANECQKELDESGVLVLQGFLTNQALHSLQEEARQARPSAFFCSRNHNVYLKDPDPDFPQSHIRNLEIVSNKGCICHDQVPKESPLRTLYEWPEFRQFLVDVLGTKIYEYEDPLSSINVNYYEDGQELGWHFDNASFAVTLMVQHPAKGGEFQYRKNVRNADAGDQGYEIADSVVSGSLECETLSMPAGTLVLFRGRNSIHRVTPVVGSPARILVTLNYNTEPGVSLSEVARMTFFGRLS